MTNHLREETFMAFMDFADFTNCECFTIESFLPYNVNKIHFITDFDGAWHNCT